MITVEYPNNNMTDVLRKICGSGKFPNSWPEVSVLVKEQLDINVTWEFIDFYGVVFESEEDRVIFEMKYA